jgi:hypothetical protein
MNRAEIDIVREITKEIETFRDFDWWMHSPEENLRALAMKTKSKIDIKDEILNVILNEDKSEIESWKDVQRLIKRLEILKDEKENK